MRDDRSSRQSSVSGTRGDIVHAALRGAVASMAMTGMRELTVSLGWVTQAPPQQLAGESRGRTRAAVEAAHWGFGALAAAGYGSLPGRWRAQPWTGPAFGMLIWSSFEVAAPMLGLPHAERGRVSERVALAADHLLYGLILDEMRRAPQR